MHTALRLARRGLGQVWPDAAVGCVITSTPDQDTEGYVIARGWSDRRCDAIERALQQAQADGGPALKGCSVYLTSVPSPDSFLAILAVQPARLRVAQGASLLGLPKLISDRLKQADIDVALGLCRDEAAQLNRGYAMLQQKHRPRITYKLATSLDGRIATRPGQSQSITGTLARRLVHAMRAEADAVLIGSTTALVDNPLLTCRLPGLEHRSPIRIVADGRLRLPMTSRLVQTANETPTWILTRKDADAERIKAFRQCGVEVLQVDVATGDQLDLVSALAILGNEGLTNVLVEGGARIGASLIAQGLVERLAWFQAPKIIGDEGVPAIAHLGLATPEDAKRWRRVATYPIGEDLLQIFDAVVAT